MTLMTLCVCVLLYKHETKSEKRSIYSSRGKYPLAVARPLASVEGRL